MKRILIIVISFVVVVSSPSSAKDQIRKSKVSANPHLYVLSSSKGIEVKGVLLPDRVYMVFSPSFHSWVFSLTDKRAEFATPAEILNEGTVLQARLLGENSSKRYKLSSKGEWLATTESEGFRILKATVPPRLETRTFSSVEGNPYSPAQAPVPLQFP